jgi:dihydroneopterin aldolase/2-amino-4-hydroxy-6-hydroxymethyldihydropteridine diphosphokinase
MAERGVSGKMDAIKITNLEIFAKHGVFPEEKKHSQRFLVSASLFTDIRNAGKTDNLARTIDYGLICDAIKNFMEGSSLNLIETIAEKLAEKLLTENPSVIKVRLEVSKPDAPVEAVFESISVEIERGRHTAYIALGSNVGDREQHLNFAVDELSNTSGCRVRGLSGLINTKPYGVTQQEDYLNGCLELETLLTPYELLDLLHEIENKAGRKRGVRWGPRTLDLDIIFYDDIVMIDEHLKIPHAEMHIRDFVLIPLKEIAPNKTHPVFNKRVTELLDDLPSDNRGSEDS